MKWLYDINIILPFIEMCVFSELLIVYSVCVCVCVCVCVGVCVCVCETYCQQMLHRVRCDTGCVLEWFFPLGAPHSTVQAGVHQSLTEAEPDL